ncbi:MAG: DoxX family protein [Thermoanaerobaculia bacterium]
MRQDLGLLILRLALGGMLMTHGWGKVLKVFSGDFTFSDPLGIGAAPSLVLAAAGEFLFALLVLLGVRTRWTAIPPAITMAVAAFVAHAGDPFGRREKALLFLSGFVALALLGGGRYTVEALVPKLRRKG